MLHSLSQRTSLWLTIVFLCAQGISPVANSAIFNVDDDILFDFTDSSPGDGVCLGLAVAFTGCSIRAAVMEANALPGIDIIILPANVTLPLTRDGNDNNAFNGDLDILESVIIGTFILSDDEFPTVDGNGMDNRIFDIHPGAEVTLQNFRITGGDATNLGNVGRGGAIFIRPSEDTSVTIDHLDIMANTAEQGGAIYSQDTMVTIIDSLIHNNAASEQGGAIVSNGDTLFIQESSIYDNFNFGPRGEAILVTSSDQFGGTAARISNTSIIENSNSGIFANGQFILNLENVTLSNNQTNGLVATPETTDQTPSLLMSHTLIANNGDNNCAFGSLDFSTDNFNIVDDQSCISMGTTNIINIDPLLDGPQQDSESWHRINPPRFGSLALDNGDPMSDGCTAIDQRGNSRPQDGNNDNQQQCDIGALEVLPVSEVFLVDGFEE